ncbi:hypothetical protein [Chitinimonas koreensis]|uniref:hypothetical protein n=1 Tax=Chitinimonas koreensis TaxID=356302 RepID=UPI0005563D9A|nr:hypothetical protein [Chitinimonas koreensis]QNM97050.1 hypothetical protein H9L41_01555 [Chitinimonas koreensis]
MPTSPLSGRLLRGVLGASLLLGLGACASRPDAPRPAENLTLGWQEHTRPLFSRGPSADAGRTAWWVPATLPRGSYRLIERDGDKATLIDDYRFEIDGSVSKEITLLLPSRHNNVEAVDERYVVGGKPARPAY